MDFYFEEHFVTVAVETIQKTDTRARPMHYFVWYPTSRIRRKINRGNEDALPDFPGMLRSHKIRSVQAGVAWVWIGENGNSGACRI